LNMEIRLKSFELPLLLRAYRQIRHCSIQIDGIRSRTHKYTVLRSPHVHKKSREQFQVSVHQLVVRCDPKYIDTLKHIQFLGVQMQITLINKGYMIL